MQCFLNLTADECSEIICYLTEGFRDICERLDPLDLEDEKERADFEELMRRGRLIQQIATLRDEAKRKEHADIKA